MILSATLTSLKFPWGLKQFQTTFLPSVEYPKHGTVELSPDEIIQRLYLLAEYISIRIQELKYQLKKIKG